MRAEFIQHCKLEGKMVSTAFGRSEHRAMPAVIMIDGHQWSSPVPANGWEAETFNRDAERIVNNINDAWN